MSEETEKSAKNAKKRLGKDLARMAAVAAVFIALALVLNRSYVRNEIFDIHQIRARFRGEGLADELSFIGAASIVNALGVPRIWVSVVAGSVYGAVKGSTIALIATLIGTTINFYVARYLLRGPIKRQLPGGLRKWYDLFNRNGFQGTLYMRFFPLANATVTNMIGGASKISYGVFIAASLIGFIPLTVVFAIFGSSAAKQNGLQLTMGIVLFAAVILGDYLWRRTHRMPTELDEDNGTSAVEPEKEDTQ